MTIDCPAGVAFRPPTTDRDLHTAGYHPSDYINEPDSYVYFAIGSVLLSGRQERKHAITSVIYKIVYTMALNSILQHIVLVVLR